MERKLEHEYLTIATIPPQWRRQTHVHKLTPLAKGDSVRSSSASISPRASASLLSILEILVKHF